MVGKRVEGRSSRFLVVRLAILALQPSSQPSQVMNLMTMWAAHRLQTHAFKRLGIHNDPCRNFNPSGGTFKN
jgi:hypothetical protein